MLLLVSCASVVGLKTPADCNFLFVEEGDSISIQRQVLENNLNEIERGCKNGEYNSTHVAGIFKSEKDAWEFYEVYENPYYGITGIQQHEVF